MAGWVAAGAVALAGLVCVGYLAFFFVMGFFNPFGDRGQFGEQMLDEKAAADAMQRREIVIPEGFTFDAMHGYIVFTGADSYWGRYHYQGTLADAAAKLTAANPEFSEPTQVGCDNELVVEHFAQQPGFTCRPDTQLLISNRDFAPNFAGIPTDAESVLLVGVPDQAQRVELFVVSEGH